MANQIRELMGLGSQKIDMGKFIEFILPKAIPEFYFVVLPKNKMSSVEAMTYPNELFMEIREDVYEDLMNGNGRAQFTLAHEFGHLVLHAGIDKELSFARQGNKHEAYEDSEWQADTFSSEFLMPIDEAIKCKNAEEILQKFGVSFSAATVRFNRIN